MLSRTRCCLEGLQSHQSTFFNTGRPLPKIGRLSNQHGSNGTLKLRKVEPFAPSICRSMSNDRQSRSRLSHNSKSSITTSKTASPEYVEGNEQFLPSTEQLVQLVAFNMAPASLQLFYKEQSCKESFLDLSSERTLEHDTTLQRVERLQSTLATGQSNDSLTDSKRGHKGQEDIQFPAPDSFVPRDDARAELERKGSATSVSTYEPSNVVSPFSISTSTRRVDSGEETTLHKIWKKDEDKSRMGSLILLNILAAVYGSSNVADGIVADAAPSLPASLTSLVRFTSALIFFAPALISALKNRDMGLLRAGAELGGLSFAATVVESYNPTSGSSSSAALLFAFTVIFVPMMEICAGRQIGSGSTLTRFATLAAISGMGLLEEEGFGWRGISCPQIGDVWGMAVSIISAVHIFRSETHGGRFDPLRLNAVQCGVLAILSLGWETFNTFDATALRSHDIIDQIQSLPWAPLIYNGLVCGGLCSWLELHGLRSLHASTATLVYTTIPVWGAILSYFAHRETPIYVESSMFGALVILATSIYAQMTTSNKNTDLRSQSNSFTSTDSGPQRDLEGIDNQEGSMLEESQSGTDIGETAKDELSKNHKSADYFPGALLTSQLKFPYYATQAKMLLADVKIKLGALKSVLLTTISSSIVTSTTGTSGSPSVNPAGGAGASSNTNGASSLPGSTPHIDVSTVHHIAPHGPAIVGPLSSPGSHGQIISATLSTSHTFDSTAVAVYTVFTHTLTALTSGFESTLVAVGSDIILGFEEAEDVATFLERLIQTGVENAAHTLTVGVAGGAAWLSNTSLTSNFVESAADMHRLALGGNFILPFASHVTDGVIDFMLQHGVSLVQNLH